MTNPQPRIFFVPGIRPKPDPAEHAAQLLRCLLFSYAEAGGEPGKTDLLRDSFQLIDWSHDFYGEHKPIAPDMPGIERLLSNVDSNELALRDASAFSRRVVGSLYALADYFPILGTTFSTRRMKTRVQEIQRYFADASGEASAARLKLASALRDAWTHGQPVLLLGHSFGSVIAYDTLWELSQQEDCGEVDTFITMGSPLTMHFINDNLLGADKAGPMRYPSCIKHWINLAAVGEVTALDRRLSERFAPMLEQGLVESIEDDLALIGRFREPDNSFNVHKCYGYMASTEFGRLLLKWLKRIAF